MRTPTPAQLLQVWERAGEQSADAGSLLLLDASCEECDAETIAAWPLGQRDAQLLALRRRLFGADIVGVAACPSCSGTVEASFRCDDLLLPGAGRRCRRDAELRRCDARACACASACPTAATCWRLKTAAMRRRAACLAAGPLRGGRARTTANRSPRMNCRRSCRRAWPRRWPRPTRRPTCNWPSAVPIAHHEWQPAFDIARFLWQELQAWALRMLRDVDTLAHAYHWSEQDILALGPRRRQAYLELCGS